MVVRHQDTVVLDEVEQVRHLLKIRGNIGVVAAKMRVVKLNVNDVLDAASGRFQVAGTLSE
jgi:hypothetical protein